MKNMLLTGSKLWLNNVAGILGEIGNQNNTAYIAKPKKISDQELARRDFYLMRYRRFY